MKNSLLCLSQNFMHVIGKNGQLSSLHEVYQDTVYGIPIMGVVNQFKHKSPKLPEIFTANFTCFKSRPSLGYAPILPCDIRGGMAPAGPEFCPFHIVAISQSVRDKKALRHRKLPQGKQELKHFYSGVDRQCFSPILGDAVHCKRLAKAMVRLGCYGFFMTPLAPALTVTPRQSRGISGSCVHLGRMRRI